MNVPIKLSRDGTWWHDNREVTHERTRELFFKSVQFQNGRYVLTGEKAPVPIEVEDVAFFVKGLRRAQGRIFLQISNHTEEALDFASLDLPQNNELRCRLQNGAEAKFSSKAYYEITRGLKAQNGYLGLVDNGLFYPLQRAENVRPAKKVKPAPKSKSKSSSKLSSKSRSKTVKTKSKRKN